MCFRPRSQCPAVGLAGLKEAAGTGGASVYTRRMAAETGADSV